LHDQKIGIIDVELHGLEEVLDRLLLRAMSIDEVFACAAEHDLSCDRYLTIFLEADGRLFLVTVVEDDRHAGFGYACLAAFVD
jgi:hypothetical protein